MTNAANVDAEAEPQSEERLSQPAISSKSAMSDEAFRLVALRTVRDRLPPISAGLAILYAIFALGHLLVQPDRVVAVMLPTALATSASLLGLYLGLRASRVPLRLAHAALGGIAALVLINSLLHLYLVPEPYNSTNLSLTLLGCGVFFRSRAWFAAAVGAATLGWLVIVSLSPPNPEWVHFGFMMLTAGVLSILFFLANMRAVRERKSLGALFREMTLRRLAEDRLSASEARNRALLEAIPDLILRLDSSGTYLDVASGRESEPRVTPEDLLGRSIVETLGPESAAETMRHLKNTVETGESAVFEEQVEIDGVSRELETRFVPYGDGEVLGIVRDVTKRRRAEEERARLEVRMREAQKAESLAVLAGGVAHDFNNLLTGILGNANLALADLPPDSPVREFVDEIEVSALRAADLSGQMLAYSGRGSFALETLDLNELFRETVHLLKAATDGRAQLLFDFDKGLPPLTCDPTQIRQLIMNLVTNASEAVDRSGGAITLRTRLIDADGDRLQRFVLGEGLSPGRYVSIEVSDNGVGMNPDRMARIFDPFFTTKFTGRGLGLAVVYGIVQGHEGGVAVDSEPGAGTRVEVLLPADRQPAPPAAKRENGPDAWRGGGTILVIDDEEVVRRVARRQLERAGFLVLTAREGYEGLRAFREHASEISLVLLDTTMPRLDGEATLRELRALDPDLPVLLISGYDEQETLNRFGDHVLTGFVHKPFRGGELISKIRRSLEGS